MLDFATSAQFLLLFHFSFNNSSIQHIIGFSPASVGRLTLITRHTYDQQGD